MKLPRSHEWGVQRNAYGDQTESHRVLVIFNPASGLRRLRRGREYFHKALAIEGIPYDWLETEPRGVQPWTTLPLDHYSRIIVIGGDGTIREVAAHLIDQNIRTPIGIVSQGSANILAQALRIPLLPLKRTLHCALHAQPKPIDVMRINRTWYALVGVGQGYDSVFINGATLALKQRIGFFAYFVSFLKTYFFERSSVFKLSIDGRRFVVVGKVVLVLNTFALPGIPMHETISPQDGILNVVVFNPRTLWDALRIIGSLLLSSSLHRTPRVQSFLGKCISIQQRRGKWIQLDGDVVRAKNLQVEVLPGAIAIAAETAMLVPQTEG